MSKVRVAGFSVSLDGFSAGIEQSLSDPLGKRGTEIFQWFFHTGSFRSMHGQEGGSVGDIDDEFAHRAMDNFGAFILGRNMFGPVRGAWPDKSCSTFPLLSGGGLMAQNSWTVGRTTISSISTSAGCSMA
jgi:dihydrofolate reductase